MTERLVFTIRLAAFLAVFLGIAVWEANRPRRKLLVRKVTRWANNLGLVVLNTVSTRLLLPITAVGMAALASERGWGLFQFLRWPEWFEVLLTVLILDLAIYAQHVLFHAVPILWRVHLVHHADLDFDVTTGLRFHTLEMLLSALFKLGLTAALGPSVLAIVLFEVLLNATAIFNHSNVKLPVTVDRWLRCIVVTPDMHRVHHSTDRRETGSNFGFNMPWWDFLFGTYLPQPALGHAAMQIGVEGLRDEQLVDRLPGMLALPFRANHQHASIRSPDRSE
ncbi:MAG: sterol desaturase family protein [Planctomycetaceae bacterium]|nr:MAG: sterol desaturase family protein [Planctomycetaceae bacterium]